MSSFWLFPSPFPTTGLLWEHVSEATETHLQPMRLSLQASASLREKKKKSPLEATLRVGIFLCLQLLSGPQVSLPFPSERARCVEWVVSGSLLPTRPCSHQLPSKAHSEWRAPECPGQLARPGPPDARRWQGRTSPARVVHTPRGSAWVVPRGLGGERSCVWPLGLASPIPSSVALTQKTQQPALWPLNALHFLMRFIRSSRGKGSSESNLPTPFPSA